MPSLRQRFTITTTRICCRFQTVCEIVISDISFVTLIVILILSGAGDYDYDCDFCGMLLISLCFIWTNE